MEGAEWFAFAVGVGKNEDARPTMWRAEEARAKSKPFRIEPEGGKVSQGPTESPPAPSGSAFEQDNIRLIIGHRSCAAT